MLDFRSIFIQIQSNEIDDDDDYEIASLPGVGSGYARGVGFPKVVFVERYPFIIVFLCNILIEKRVSQLASIMFFFPSIP